MGQGLHLKNSGVTSHPCCFMDVIRMLMKGSAKIQYKLFWSVFRLSWHPINHVSEDHWYKYGIYKLHTMIDSILNDRETLHMIFFRILRVFWWSSIRFREWRHLWGQIYKFAKFQGILTLASHRKECNNHSGIIPSFDAMDTTSSSSQSLINLVQSLSHVITYADSSNVDTNRKLWDNYARDWVRPFCVPVLSDHSLFRSK